MKPDSTSRERHLPEGGLPFGRYVLERRLASGGMGEIFIGVMPGPAGFERRVVIKRILPHLSSSDEFVRRFIDEARIVVQLQHGNIVPVFEMGEERGEYYIAMEYLPGWDLKAVQQRCVEIARPVPIPLVLLLGIEVARGLAYAHRKCDDQGRELAIVHRDVSPSNILLGRDGVVKITDFGIAKAASKMVNSVSGMLRGKFGYMSPEQAAGLELDRRSDVFSLGVVLWETLVGQRLFEADSDTAILRKIQACEVAPPSMYRPEIPPEVDAPILHCLQRDRRVRLASADELEQALTSLLVRLYPGTGSSSLATFLGEVFAEERRRQERPARPSFDDLLRAELEGLQYQPASHPPTQVQFTPTGNRPAVRLLRHEGSEPATGEDQRAAHREGSGEAAGARSAGLRPESWSNERVVEPLSGGWTSLATDPTVTMERERPRGRKRMILLGIFLTLLAGLTGSGIYWALAGQRTVALEVLTQPQGALVSLDGILLGRSETDWPPERSVRLEGIPADPRLRHQVRVRWPGHEPLVRQDVTVPYRWDVERPRQTSIREAATHLLPELEQLESPDRREQRLRLAGFCKPLPGIRTATDLPERWIQAALERIPEGRTRPKQHAPVRPMSPTGPPTPPPEVLPALPVATGFVAVRCSPTGTIQIGTKSFDTSTGRLPVEVAVGPCLIRCRNERLGRQKELTVTVQAKHTAEEPLTTEIVLEKEVPPP